MQFLVFLRDNARWIAGGFLLTLFSSFGQTFFIALSAGEIRQEFNLSHGQFGGVYMIATLASALTFPWIGQLVDRYTVRKMSTFTILALVCACLAMMVSTHVAALVLVIYALRLFGQGMMTHIALTAMGKWYAGNRGQAVSVTSIGVNFGEAIFPILFVAIAGLYGWRNAWLASAILLLFALPVIATLFSRDRTPRSTDPPAKVTGVRDWTRREVLRDPLFYALQIGVLAPAFIGTTIFFHQVHLAELRGWSMETFAASYVVLSVSVISFALIAGQLIDRYSALQLLPAYLLPLAAACLILGQCEAQWSAFAFMALLGVSYGFSSSLFGSVWPELYGTKNLGSIRSVIIAMMVFATAAGPGITGYFIDAGIEYPLQITLMGLYCLAAAVMMTIATRVAIARTASVGSSL
ncbi:MAG: MFS transporter [Rhizobiaceae bacterium]